MGTGRVYSYSQTIPLPPSSHPTPPQKKERGKDEWNSFINKQEMKKKALLAEKQAKKQRGEKKEGARKETERSKGTCVDASGEVLKKTQMKSSIAHVPKLSYL